MPRCIVLIGGHELLRDGWRKRSFAPAGSLLDSRVKVAGVRFDETYHPVRVLRARQSEIVGVFADPAVSPFPSSYCGSAAIGATEEVARRLGVPALRRAGLTGRGVHVAIVDTGIDGSRIPVAGGWAPT